MRKPIKRRGRYRLNPPPELSGLLTSSAAAALLGCSIRTLYSIVRDGDFACSAEFGRAHLFDREDVLEARRRLYGR